MRYIAPVEDSFFRLKKVRSAAGKILQLIIDHKLHVCILSDIEIIIS